MKYRLTYKKFGIAQYIGHLDLQSVFQRSLRRAGLKPRYSAGFNPHPLLSFASPLAVGIEGYGEVVDIELQTAWSDVSTRLNAALPQGLAIVACREAAGEKSAASLLRKAAYELRFSGVSETAVAAAVAAYSGNELVYGLEARGDTVLAVLACGGNGNLKPQALAEALFAGADARVEYVRRELIF